MDKLNLLKALILTSPSLGSRNLIPGLDSFHFTDKRVTTFNGTLTLSAPLDFDFPIKGAISGDTFLKFIKELDAEIDLQATSSEGLTIKYGNKSETQFTVQSIDSAFLNDADESNQKINLPTSVMFAAGLKRCMSSLGSGKTGGEAGVYLFIEDNECRLYSSNGYNSSRFIFSVENYPNTEIFLPAAFCEQLLFLYASLNVEPTEMCATEKYLRAKFGEVTLRSGFYSNPVNTELKALVDDCIIEAPFVEITKDFKESIKRAGIISASKSVITISYGVENNSQVTINAKGSGQELMDSVDLAYPLEGQLKLDVNNIHRVIESCNLIGFNENYLVLQGNEGNFDYLVSAKIGNN